MSSVRKSNTSKSVIFETQYEMCNTVYRKLHELMWSVNQLKILFQIEEIGDIKLEINQSEAESIYFSMTNAKTGNRENLGCVSMKKLSLSEFEDPIMIYILRKQELANSRTETYSKWFVKLKDEMQELLNEQKKYEDILDEIRNIPIFSPTREVLIEKV
jgi:hypothetical protein